MSMISPGTPDPPDCGGAMGTFTGRKGPIRVEDRAPRLAPEERPERLRQLEGALFELFRPRAEDGP